MMSSKSRTISPGKRLAIAACLATAGLGLAACGDDSKSNTGPGFDQVHSPKGTVNGSVVDENGKALAGVTVALAGQTTTTDASGQYQFKDVAVTGTVSDGATSGGFNTPLPITLTAPAGYLGATVNVNPSAQLTCTNSAIAVGNPQCVIADGFNVGAGTTQLPAVNAVVSGTLRDGDTHAPLAGVALYAKLSSVLPNGTAASNGVNVSYASGSSVVVSGGQTAADGSFSFPALAANACYSVYAVGYNVTLVGSDVGACAPAGPGAGGSGSGIAQIQISTDNSPVQLNQIFAVKSPNADVVAPFVVKVDHVLDQAAAPKGQLDSSVTNVLVLTFSERVTYTAATSNPVTVIAGSGFNSSNQQISSIDLDSTGTVMTITLANPLPVNADVSVNLPVEAVADTASNLLVANPAANVGFDSAVTANNSSYVQLNLQTFKPTTTATGVVTMSQNFGPDATSATDPVLSKLFASSNALVNVVGDFANFGSAYSSANTFVPLTVGSPVVAQLNSAQASPLVADQLAALATAFNGGTAVTADTTVARVTLTLATPANVADVALQVTDALGNPKDVLIFPQSPAVAESAPVGTTLAKAAAANNSTVETPNIGLGTLWFGIDPKGAATFDVVVIGNGVTLAPGDQLHVVARSASGGVHLIDNGAVLSLKDSVGPTAALQILGATQGNAGSGTLGQGGVIFTGGTAAGPSTVIFPVTPQLGNTSDASEANAGIYAGNSFKQELYNPSGLKAAGAANAALPDGAGNLRTDTDATGVDAYLKAKATSAGSLDVKAAIAVTESVTSAATLSVPYTGTAALTGFGAIPNVISKQSGPVATPVAGVVNDLVTLSINNIFTLAADGRANKVIDLTGTITDANGNVAAAGDNARVVVQDLFPPLMTAAYTDGTNYTFTFNEPIQLSGALTVYNCADVPASIDLKTLAALTPAQASVTGNVLKVAASAFGANVCFYPTVDTQHTYAESFYTTANTGVAAIPAKLQHAYVSFNNVADSVGNVWEADAGTPAANQGTPWADRVLGMGAPRFAMVNLTSPLGVGVAQQNFANNSTNFTVTITSTQPTYNFFTATVAPEVPVGTAAVYTTNVPLVGTVGSNPCQGTTAGATPACNTFLGSALTLTSACTVGPTSTATLNGANTSSSSLTFSLVCGGATKVATGDTVSTNVDNTTFQSVIFDPTNPPNNYSTTATVNGTVFTAN